jgi:hypothetical protein
MTLRRIAMFNLLTLLILPIIGLRAEAQCKSPNEFLIGPFAKPPSLAIRLFGVKFHPEFPVRRLEGFRVNLAEELREQLLKSGFFSSVTIAPDDVETTADLVLTGDLTEVVVGSNSLSWYNIVNSRAGDQPSTVALSGMITPRSSDTPTTTFECFAGYTWGTAGSKANKSIMNIAKYLKNVYADMAKPRKKSLKK